MVEMNRAPSGSADNRLGVAGLMHCKAHQGGFYQTPPGGMEESRGLKIRDKIDSVASTVYQVLVAHVYSRV